MLLYPRGVTPRRLLLVGLGKREKATAETIRRAAATAIKEAQKLLVAAVTISVQGQPGPWNPEAAAQAFAEGIERAGTASGGARADHAANIHR